MLWSSVHSWFLRDKTPIRNKETSRWSPTTNTTSLLLSQAAPISLLWGPSIPTPPPQEGFSKRSDQTLPGESGFSQSGIFDGIWGEASRERILTEAKCRHSPTKTRPYHSGQHRLDRSLTQGKGTAVQSGPSQLADHGHSGPGFLTFAACCKDKRM